MSVTMLRHKVKDDRIQEAEAAVRDWFEALDRERPEGLRYASTRLPDSSTFLILTELDESIEDPRQVIPEFHVFLERLKELVEGPPTVEQLEVVGSYNLFDVRTQDSPV
jgi:hypothetical protein